jgi:type II secretory pathway pseudopilin PulG
MSLASIERRGETGFTLVETLVSLAMLTLALVALLQIFGTGFRGIRSSDLDAAALHVATAQLARVGAETRIKAGQQQGTTTAGVEWAIVVEPYQAPRAADEPVRTAGLEAYWVTCEVRWKSSAFGAPQSLQLKTLRIVAP